MNYDIFIEGVIGEEVTLESIKAQVTAAPKDITAFNVKINSGGGNMDVGKEIYDYLKSLGKPINTEVMGMCGSIATIIQQVAVPTKGERTIHQNSKDFIHNPFFPNEAPIPMEAKDAKVLHDALVEAEQWILDFYVEHTGKPKDILKAKMDLQTELTATEAQDLNFVDRVIGKEINSLRSYKVVAFYNVNSNKNNMDILKKLNEFEAKIDSFISKVGKGIKNETTKTSEGVDVYYEGVLAVGSKLFTDESLTTPAPDGVHTIGDKKYLVKDGVVTSEEEIEAAADVSALKAENEKLKAQLAEKETAIANSTTELTAVKAEKAEAVEAVKTVTEEFKNLKAQFVTGTGELKPEFQAFKGDEENKPKVINTQLNKNLADRLK